MLSIGSFSRVANITTKTLRYYDEIGLLKPCYVDSGTGYRFYDVAQLETVLLITRLKAYDFSLDEITGVLQNPRDNAAILSLITKKKAHIEDVVAGYGQVLSQIEGDIANMERGNHFMSYLDRIIVKLAQPENMNIAWVREKINVQAYGKYIGKLFAQVAEKKLTPVGPPMTIYHSEEFTPESYDMEIAVPVAESGEGTRAYAPGLCASAVLKGPYASLPAVYAKIQAWMEAEGYVSAAPAFEVYSTDPAQTPQDENVTEVYVPVKKQS